jgi:hypothetical protein
MGGMPQSFPDLDRLIHHHWVDLTRRGCREPVVEWFILRRFFPASTPSGHPFGIFLPGLIMLIFLDRVPNIDPKTQL